MQDKNYGISLARGIACIFIVMVHAIPALEVYTGKDMWRTWFAIGVPVFIIISGNLARKEKETSIMSFIKKKCRRILLPYWIWIVLAFVIYWLAGCEFSKENFFTMMFMGQNNGQYNSYVLPGFGQLWFVPFIMGCYCLVPVLHIVVQEILSHKRKCHAVYLGGVCCAGYITIKFWNFIGPTPYLWYYVLFIASYVFSAYFDIYKQKVKIFIIIILFAVIIINIQYCRYVYVDNISLVGSQFLYVYRAITGVALYLTFQFVGKKLKSNRIFIKIVSFTDDYSYEIYLVHKFWLSGYMSVNQLGLNIVWKNVIGIVLIVFSAWLLKSFTKLLNGCGAKRIK